MNEKMTDFLCSVAALLIVAGLIFSFSSFFALFVGVLFLFAMLAAPALAVVIPIYFLYVGVREVMRSFRKK